MKKKKSNKDFKKIKALTASAEILSGLGYTKTVDTIVDKIDQILIKL